MENSGETGSGEEAGQDPGQLGGGRAAEASASHPAPSNPCWPGDCPSGGLGLIPGQGFQGPQGDYAPGPSLNGPSLPHSLAWRDSFQWP